MTGAWWGRIVVTAGIGLSLVGPLEAKRVSLVIGNDAYHHLPRLETALGDAEAIKAALERLGFDVTLAQNLDYASLLHAFATFEASIEGGDEVVVHFSGHGVSVNGRNYLLPVDMKEPGLASLIPGFSRDAADMVEGIRLRQPKYVFAILDACRNNPFQGPARSLATSRGLARMQAEAGAFILFSAGPGEAALDRLPGERVELSVFTRVLLKHLETPGLSLQDIAEFTKDEVKALAATANNHQQFPDYSARVVGRPILKPALARDNTPTTSLATQAEADVAYDLAMLDNSDAALIDFARRFPTDPRAEQILTLLHERGSRQEIAGQLATGTPLHTIRGHTDDVMSVAFSPDGRRLASASDDATVKVWDVASGELLQTLAEHESMVWSVTFSPDGSRLASASWDNTVKLWDAASGRVLKTVQGHGSFVSSVVFSPDGRRIASASDDKTMNLWDAASGTLLRTFEASGTGATSAVVFSPDGRRLASVGRDGNTVKFWDASSGALRLSLQGHGDTVIAMAFSPDGQLFASASHDTTVKLWDAASGTSLQTLQGHDTWVTSVAFSPDGRRLASAGFDNTVKLWNPATGVLLQTLQGHEEAVWSVAFSPDGRFLASAGQDDTVRLWIINPEDDAAVTGR